MNAQGLSTDTFSYSRTVTRKWRQIYTHRLQWFRWVLGLAAAIHLTPNFGKLYWHYNTHHTPSVLPDFLSFSLSVAARFIWLFLFRDPSAFLQLKRPGKAYRCIVCGTAALTTLPNSLVHVWALKMALQNDSNILAGIIPAILAIILLLPLMALVWWMAWMFLLGLEESAEEFEPTVKDNMAVTTGLEWQQLTSALGTSTQTLSVVSTSESIDNGYLSQAYEEQRSVAESLSALQSHTSPIETPQVEDVPAENTEESVQLFIETNTISNIDVASSPRCPTIAQFTYMSQSHSGPHSWFSYPLIPLILSIYATALLIGLPIWIHEDRQYKLRAPSPTIKKSLYLPLGLYLLSFHASRHRVHATLFERFEIQPPEPWKKMLSILPSWVGTGGTFKNLDTGEITAYDPRRRAFPWRAYHQPALIETRDYLDAYNANPGECNTFWGHSGRNLLTSFRFRPTIHRIGFVFLAICITWNGFWNTLFYNPPNVYEEILKHPKTIKPEDIARISRILRLWQAFAYSGLWFVILALVFAVGCMGSMLVLFVRTVWKYVPQEEKDSIMRQAREREQTRREGQIRLE